MIQKIAIVILNWNGKKHLQEFLPSVVANSPDGSVYVIDNGSTDDSITFLDNNYPDINKVILPDNYGFCGGYNKGLQNINAEYYVILNSDVEVTPNWLDKPLELLDENLDIAVCQPKICDYKDKSKLEYAGAAGGYIDSLGYPFCRGRIFDTVEQDTPAFNDTREIFWATGAAFFIRSNIYHELNGFEELFFAHMEEIDLCWRIRNRGFRIYYCGESTVYHLGGGTLNTLNPKKTFLNFRNGLSLLYRNLPASQLLYKIPMRLILDGIAGLKFLMSGEYRHTIAVLKAHFGFYRMAINLNRPKRIYINHTAILRKSIVWLYFIKKKTKFSDLKDQIS